MSELINFPGQPNLSQRTFSQKLLNESTKKSIHVDGGYHCIILKGFSTCCLAIAFRNSLFTVLTSAYSNWKKGS